MTDDTTIQSMPAIVTASAKQSQGYEHQAQRRKPEKPSVRNLMSPKRKGADCAVGSGAQGIEQAGRDAERSASRSASPRSVRAGLDVPRLAARCVRLAVEHLAGERIVTAARCSGWPGPRSESPRPVGLNDGC